MISKAKYTLRLYGNEHFNDELSCLGWQLAKLLEGLKTVSEDYKWYVFDLYGTSEGGFNQYFLTNSNGLCEFFSIDTLIKSSKKIIQYETGVFVMFPKQAQLVMSFDEYPRTEEEEGMQIPKSIIEIRAFDFSYFEVYCNDEKFIKLILDYIKK
ncbi:hypothetical protein ACUXCC_002325 [Cytobacillus horneckiae]|uniref:DUF2691 domain-containing protein n=2 Tax=Cytobacillus horneckiae TaxID=549687 RepID=A0A2N0Z946_9BACI|nr:hypothetical protein [Cytobacillus horneckiae]MBN6888314.1 hypothetical protein [Cytobacillus horneckiae]MCM3181221.1 hypothetical protein [Cytobacillus horneckiae]MEC1155457.1 hypothetical protein [Cytobacillus horneckiae]MED2940506.1 hypothetical protein [Cytobacillus horneckiae]PKG26032.1 hypothetical protein CWS20_26205 [Cytobacillus horneckiae]